MKVTTRQDVKRMNNAPKLFVRFKSNMCPHCVNSQAGWDEMTRCVAKDYTMMPGCAIGEIESAFADSFQAKAVDGSPFQVQGVPAYEIFKNGKQVKTSPPERDAAGLLKVLKKHKFIKPKGRTKMGGSRRRKTRRGARSKCLLQPQHRVRLLRGP